MAVTTYNELYALLKEGEVHVQYDKGEYIGVLGIKGTLKRDLIPSTDSDTHQYDTAIQIGDWSLSEDSDGALYVGARRKIELSNTTYPNWIKLYSTNYQEWFNIKIDDIKSVEQVVDA